MVATASRKDVSARRSKASRRGGKQNSGRNAAQLAQKLRAQSAATEQCPEHVKDPRGTYGNILIFNLYY